MRIAFALGFHVHEGTARRRVGCSESIPFLQNVLSGDLVPAWFLLVMPTGVSII